MIYIIITTCINNKPGQGVQDNIHRQNRYVESINHLLQLINNDLSQWRDKYTWIRKESSNVTDEEMPDNSLDAIFVDGDHTYTGAYNDLTKYWNKVACYCTTIVKWRR